jgi:hypothetical protein
MKPAGNPGQEINLANTPLLMRQGVGRCTLVTHRQRPNMDNNVVKISSSRHCGKRHLYEVHRPTPPPCPENAGKKMSVLRRIRAGRAHKGSEGGRMGTNAGATDRMPAYRAASHGRSLNQYHTRLKISVPARDSEEPEIDPHIPRKVRKDHPAYGIERTRR